MNIVNVLAFVAHFGPALASLAAAAPSIFKTFDTIVGWLVKSSGVLVAVFPQLAPVAKDLEIASSFLAAHEDAIKTDVVGFLADAQKVFDLLKGFDTAKLAA